MKYNQITYEACLPAYKKAAENAKKHGSPCGIIITTTPNNLDVEAGAFCYDMMSKAAKWSVDCFDMNDEELTNFIFDNSSNDFILVQYSYKELGRDEKWLQEMIRQCNGNLQKIKREILLEWPRSMDSSVLSEEQLEKIHQFIKEPLTRLFVDSYPLTFYETPDINLNYIISCDVAGGLSRDNSVMTIIHPEDFRVVGDFVNNKIDTDNFKKLIEKTMKFYFRNALLIIEKNSYGLNIIQSLMKDPDIEPRMYREEKEALGEKKQTNGFTVKKKTKTISYGVDTNTSTRKQMFDMLPEIVETEYDKFVSPNMFDNLASLEKKRTGKIEHSASGHDDSLMSYLIFRYAVFHGKCFRDRFGISPVPSRLNVRVESSIGDIQKIEAVIMRANSNISNANFDNTYNLLAEQERKLNKDTDTQLNSFMRIVNLNK